eukprot:4845120-Pyramimonas_sp.AAC.1
MAMAEVLESTSRALAHYKADAGKYLQQVIKEVGSLTSLASTIGDESIVQAVRKVEQTCGIQQSGAAVYEETLKTFKSQFASLVDSAIAYSEATGADNTEEEDRNYADTINAWTEGIHQLKQLATWSSTTEHDRKIL